MIGTVRAAQGNVEVQFVNLSQWGHFRPSALPEDCLVFLPYVSRKEINWKNDRR